MSLPETTSPSHDRDFLKEAWLEAVASETYVPYPLTITNAEVVEGDAGRTLGVLLEPIADGSDCGPVDFTLYVRHAKDPALAWRDLPVLMQLQQLTGRRFASLAELAEGLVGLRFQAALIFTRLPGSSRFADDLILAEPVPPEEQRA